MSPQANCKNPNLFSNKHFTNINLECSKVYHTSHSLIKNKYCKFRVRIQIRLFFLQF